MSKAQDQNIYHCLIPIVNAFFETYDYKIIRQIFSKCKSPWTFSSWNSLYQTFRCSVSFKFNFENGLANKSSASMTKPKDQQFDN